MHPISAAPGTAAAAAAAPTAGTADATGTIDGAIVGAGTLPVAPASRATMRTAGALYAAIIAFGLFAELAVRGTLVIPGDAAETAANIRDAQWLFRVGFGADLIVFLADVALAVLLYRLFAPVDRAMSALAAAFRLTQTAIIGLNLLNMFLALHVLRSGTAAADDEVASRFLDAHRYGYVLGLTFFGVSTVLIGWLVARSGAASRWLAILVVVAGVGYLADSFAWFLVPDYEGGASAVILAPAVVAEVWLCGWLLRARRAPGERPAT